jgi:hypothetical protein
MSSEVRKAVIDLDLSSESPNPCLSLVMVCYFGVLRVGCENACDLPDHVFCRQASASCELEGSVSSRVGMSCFRVSLQVAALQVPERQSSQVQSGGR